MYTMSLWYSEYWHFILKVWKMRRGNVSCRLWKQTDVTALTPAKNWSRLLSWNTYCGPLSPTYPLNSVSFSFNERRKTKLHRHPSPSCVECVALGGSLAPLKVQVSRPCWGASFCRGGSTPIDEPGLVFAQSCGAFFRNSFDSRTGWSRHCDDITIIIWIILRSISLRCPRNLFAEPL